LEAIVMPGQHHGDPKLEQFWRKMLADWQKSGRTVRAFCANRQLSEASFYGWRRTLRQRDEQRPAARPLPKLVPLRVVAEAILEIVLPGGLVVRVPAGADADAVAQLVAALRGAPC
jgi:hypothetical protein